MDRLYKAVWEKVNEGGPFQKALFTFAYEYKKKRFDRGYDVPIFTRSDIKALFCDLISVKIGQSVIDMYLIWRTSI